MHKIMIHFVVAAHEYSNAVGEHFWRVYSKKRFCEDIGIDFFGEVFLGFLRGVIERGVHCRIVSFYEGFLTVFPFFIVYFLLSSSSVLSSSTSPITE